MRSIHISIATSLFFTFCTAPVYSCTSSHYGTLENYQPIIWNSLLQSRSVAATVDPDIVDKMDGLSIERSNIDGPDIFVKNRRIFYGDRFVRKIAHLANFEAFLSTNAQETFDEKTNRAFVEAMTAAANEGSVATYYTDMIGMPLDKCIVLWREKDLRAQVVRSAESMAMFWGLHEIAHVVLGHRQRDSALDRWAQEMRADRWAMETLGSFFEGPTVMLLPTDIIAGMDISHLGVGPASPFLDVTTHPSVACRKLWVIDWAENLKLGHPDHAVFEKYSRLRWKQAKLQLKLQVTELGSATDPEWYCRDLKNQLDRVSD